MSWNLLRRLPCRVFSALVACVVVSASAVRADGPLDFIPANTDVIGMVDVAAILKSDAFAKMAEEFPEIKTKLTESLGPNTKLTAKDIEKVFVAGCFASKEFVVIMRTTRKVELSEVIANDDYKEEEIGDFTLYVKNESDAMTLIGDGQVILGGSTSALRKSLAAPGANELPEELQAVLETLDRDGFDAAGAAKLEAIAKQAGANAPPPFTPELLSKFKVLTISATCDENVAVKYALECTDEATAGQLKAIADFFLPVLANDAKTPPMVKEIMASMKLTTEGNTVSASLELEPEVLAELIKNAGPRGGIAPIPPPAAPGLPAPPPAPPKSF